MNGSSPRPKVTSFCSLPLSWISKSSAVEVERPLAAAHDGDEELLQLEGHLVVDLHRQRAHHVAGGGAGGADGDHLELALDVVVAGLDDHAVGRRGEGRHPLAVREELDLAAPPRWPAPWPRSRSGRRPTAPRSGVDDARLHGRLAARRRRRRGWGRVRGGATRVLRRFTVRSSPTAAGAAGWPSACASSGSAGARALDEAAAAPPPRAGGVLVVAQPRVAALGRRQGEEPAHQLAPFARLPLAVEQRGELQVDRALVREALEAGAQHRLGGRPRSFFVGVDPRQLLDGEGADPARHAGERPQRPHALVALAGRVEVDAPAAGAPRGCIGSTPRAPRRLPIAPRSGRSSRR